MAVSNVEGPCLSVMKPKLIYLENAKGGLLYRHLQCQKKRRRKFGRGKRVIIPNRISIDKRPSIVETRSRIGDLEVDTIVPSGRKSPILSLVERKSKKIKFTVDYG